MYTDRHGDVWTNPAEIEDIVCQDMIGYTPDTLTHVVDAKPATYADALSVARAYLAPLDGLTYVGGGADYADPAWLVAGDLSGPHVVVEYGEWRENWQVVALTDDMDHARCVAEFASPADAIAAARQFAASVNL